MTTIEAPFSLEAQNPSNPLFLPPEAYRPQPQAFGESMQPVHVQMAHESVPEPMPSPAPAQETAHAVDPEVERLIAFDRALKIGDRSAISAIMRQAKEASEETHGSEYRYLATRRAAHKEGRPHEALLREEAFDRALEAGDEAAITEILDRAETNPAEYANLIDRWNQAPLQRPDPEIAQEVSAREQRQAEFVPESHEALYLGKEIVAQHAGEAAVQGEAEITPEPEHVGQVAATTEDQASDEPKAPDYYKRHPDQLIAKGAHGYDEQAFQFYTDHPDLGLAAGERIKALQELINSGLDKGDVTEKANRAFAIIDAAEREAERSGFWYGYNYLRDMLPSGVMRHLPL